MRNNTRKVINYSHHSTNIKKFKKSKNHTRGGGFFSRIMSRGKKTAEIPTSNNPPSSGIQTAELGEEEFKNIIIENYKKLNIATKKKIDVAIVSKSDETYKIDFLASEALASQSPATPPAVPPPAPPALQSSASNAKPQANRATTMRGLTAPQQQHKD